MLGKLKTVLKGWSDSLIENKSKYWVVNKVRRFIAVILVNTFRFMSVSVLTGLLFFITAFIVGEDSNIHLMDYSGDGLLSYIFDKDIDLWELLFALGLFSWLGWILMAVCMFVYMIINLFKKNK